MFVSCILVLVEFAHSVLTFSFRRIGFACSSLFRPRSCGVGFAFVFVCFLFRRVEFAHLFPCVLVLAKSDRVFVFVRNWIRVFVFFVSSFSWNEICLRC